MEANFSASTLYMYMTCKFTQFTFLKIINKDKISWIADDRNLLVKNIQEKKKIDREDGLTHNFEAALELHHLGQ